MRPIMTRRSIATGLAEFIERESRAPEIRNSTLQQKFLTRYQAEILAEICRKL